MSVNPFSPLSGPFGPENPSVNLFLQGEYKTYFTQFMQNPTQHNAKEFYDFIEKNAAGLKTLAAQIDYQPNPGSTWSSTFDGLTTSLNAFIHGNTGILPAVYEWANDCRQWIGVNYPPTEVTQDVLSLMQLFEEQPSPASAETLSWIFNDPGYMQAMEACSSSPAAFQEDRLVVQKDLALYEGDPGNPNTLSALMNSLNQLQSDF